MVRVVLCAALMVSSSTSYAAQEFPLGQDVEDRPHPEYSQVGIDVGGFTLLPSVTTTLAATDNYRATSTDPKSNVSLLLRPDLTWRSNWARHRVDGSMFLEQRLNTPLQEENVITYGVTAHGLYDFSRDTKLRIGGTANRLAEDRTSLNSFQASVEPVQYTVLRVDSALSKSFNAVELQGTASLESLNYNDAELANGQSVSQDFRDYQSVTIGGSVEYSLANGIGVIVTGHHIANDYNFGPGSAGFIDGISVDRDSTGSTLQVGVTFELSSLIFGTVQVGYLTRNYEDPRIKDVSSPSFTANLLWNVTPLTSLVGNARRWVEESASPVSPGNVRSDFGLEVHHELYRYVLLTGKANFSQFKPVTIGNSGTEYDGTLAARYLLSRRVTINGDLRYLRRDSDNPLLRYNATEGRISLRYGI